MTHFKRVIWIDPNLIGNFGHVIEGAVAFNNYMKESRLPVKVIFVGNKSLNYDLKGVLSPILPIVTNTCFKDLDSKGKIFHDDLRNIDKELAFSEGDLIFIPTAFTNELIGISRFLKNDKRNLKIGIQLHQCLPPSIDFRETTQDDFRIKVESSLKNSFQSLSQLKNNVSVWSTESDGLNKYFNNLSPFTIGKLPLVMNYFPELTNLAFNTSVPTISFLGDGRFEKGLILFLSALESIDLKNVKVLIQNLNPRGYGANNHDLENKLEQVSTLKQVKILTSAYPPDQFSRLVASSTISVLPYHPMSYDRRVSEVYIMSCMYQKHNIISNSTWLHQEAQKYNVDTVFEYDLSDLNRTIKNLTDALKIALSNSTVPTAYKLNQSEKYIKYNSPNNFLAIISRYYL